MWIIFSIAIAMILLMLLGCYARRSRTVSRPRGLGISEGLAIGMLVSAAICILLVELGGYRDAAGYLLPCGIAAGGLLGLFLERRYQKQ
ncbi:MAG: hypothetical protein JSW59_02940 [Phycisphaerales bacterium]|nr:MAG: hypothetical protein JSW59_02940 [Phycisphaerales bacterium]